MPMTVTRIRVRCDMLIAMKNRAFTLELHDLQNWVKNLPEADRMGINPEGATREALLMIVMSDIIKSTFSALEVGL